MKNSDVILSIALDLNKSLGATDRYQRLLQSAKKIIPCDAACLLKLENQDLVPIAMVGLASQVLGMKFKLDEHPKLNVICNSTKAVLFSPEANLPDPFDGLLSNDPHALSHIHACLGIPLILDGKVVGALTADALSAKAFDQLDFKILDIMAALAASALRTSELMESLENLAKKNFLVASDLMRENKFRVATLIGNSSVLKKLKENIELVARTDYSVLITGETGSGKEIVAHSIYSLSKRKDRPLIYVNCAALPETLVESELFGHKKGAFTGATLDRAGKFEIAHEGTIFLDEIGELPLVIQAKLLRVLQEGEIQRVGSDDTKRVNVRILAATNRDLENEVKKGKFRLDLFHRLNVFPLHVPPLREHSEDIPLIVGSFCDSIRRKLGTGPIRVAPLVLEDLKRQPFPGNVRELKNIISRAVLTASFRSQGNETIVVQKDDINQLTATNLDTTIKNLNIPAASSLNLKEATKSFQKDLIIQTVKKSQGNWSKAASVLGLHRSNLFNLAKKLHLK